MARGDRREHYDAGMAWPHIIFAALVIGFVLVLAFIKPPKEIGVQVAVTAGAVFATMAARQCCYLLCELRRLPMRSMGSALKAAAECCQLPWSTWLVFITCFVLSFLIVREHPNELWCTFTRLGHVHLLVAFVTMLCVWMQHRTQLGWALATSSNGLAPGDGLAYSVFFTYHRPLSLTLWERMTQYEQDNDVILAIKKLIVLMPTSCYIEPELGVGGDEDIEVANRMDELKISRAGTRERKYTNTVYKIRNGDDSPFYCVAEGASPLLTLNDMRECGELTAEQQRAQMRNFIDKLRELVSANAACRSRILLVQYDDMSEDGHPVPVSSVLRNVIKKELGLT
ncbi:transmembrane protein sting isoform X2 [Dermacentor variabilis]|uniref:transmembrane protein sting isoform X2 n=1 Tax=Dermacentor variabilis TaxID=34621 RepID=UPI003F5BA2E6